MFNEPVRVLCQKEPGTYSQKPKVGDLVVISVTSGYYPHQMERGNWQVGTLYSVGGGGLPFGVRWPNGYQNSYSREDLVFLSEPPKSNLEGRFLLRSK